MAKPLTIVGHINPDTDTVTSSIVYSEFKNKQKQKTIPFLTGKLNKETEFVLDFFKVKKPSQIKNLAGKQIILVDHGNLKESVPGIEKAQIIEIIDHHKISGICTDEPILYRAEPTGSTSTIIAKIFKENRLVLNKKQAGLLLCGIISDTLNFTSPTTTGQDKKIAMGLAEISKIKANEMAEKMFAAKSDISGIKPEKIIETDYKTFQAGKKTFGFGVFETTNAETLDKIKQKIFKALQNKKNKNKLDILFFAAVDIIKQKSILYIIGNDEKQAAEKAFKIKISDDTAELKNIVSRKKQMIPPILKALK